MSSDTTRQTFASNANSSHMDVMTSAQSGLDSPIHWSEDEEAGSNNFAGGLLDEASTAKADANAVVGMSTDLSKQVQGDKALTPEPEDQTMQDLSEKMKRLSTSQAGSQASGSQSEPQPSSQDTSSGHDRQAAADKLYFSRAMERIAQSKARIIPRSSNRYSVLAEPVQPSPARTVKQDQEDADMLLAEELVADRPKRLRSSSADPSPRPTKRARTEFEDVEMGETAQKPFNFREIVDPKSSSQCFIQADDGDWFGATHGKLPNYQVNVRILGGRLGLPTVRLCFSICKKEYFDTRIDKTTSPDAFHELFCSWQPGLILDPGNPEYMIKDFEISHRLDVNKKVAMPESLATTKTDLLTKVVGVSFKSHRVILEGPDSTEVDYIDPALLNIMEKIQLQPCKVTLWYVAPGGIEYHVKNTLRHFQHALDEHLPPLHQYLIHGTQELNTDMDMLPIAHFQGGMYCRYPVKNKVEDETQPPKSFAKLPVKAYFHSILEFQIYYSVGVIREYQSQRGRMAHIAQRSHQVFLMKTFRFQSSRPEQSASSSTLAEVQYEFRGTFYAYVRMTPNKQGLQETIPPEGSLFTLDWVNKEGRNKSHEPTPKDKQWFGKVCAADSRTLNQLGAQFCLIVRKPLRSKHQHSYKQPAHVQMLPKAFLKPIFNTNPAAREVNAVHQFCNASRDELRILQLSAVFDAGHGISGTIDLRGEPDKLRENIERYSACLDAKRGRLNERQMEVLDSVKSVVNKLSLVNAPPGSGKMLTTLHLVDLLTQVGHSVLITCPSNGAVDEYAQRLWSVRPQGKKILRLEIAANDAANTLGRNGEDGRQPDRPLQACSSRADDWKHDPIYLDMLSQLASAEIALEHSSLDADMFVESSDRLRNECATTFDREGKKHNFPQGMSMAYRMLEMVQADEKASHDFELENTAINRAVARADATSSAAYDPSMKYRNLINLYNGKNGELSGQERDQLKHEYEAQVVRVLQDTDILIATCNNSGSDIVRDNFRPSVLIVDEADQSTLPATLVPMTAYSDWMTTMLVGDQQQLQPMLTSNQANEFEGNLKTSLFTHLIMKGIEPLSLNV